MTRKSFRQWFNTLASACLAMSASGTLLAADTTSVTDAASAKHHIQTVFIVLMENHNWTGDGNLDIKGNPEAPYINKTLIPKASHAEQYFNPPNLHPSLPNYLWLEAGTNFGIYDDGGSVFRQKIDLECERARVRFIPQNQSQNCTPFGGGEKLSTVSHDTICNFEHRLEHSRLGPDRHGCL